LSPTRRIKADDDVPVVGQVLGQWREVGSERVSAWTHRRDRRGRFGIRSDEVRPGGERLRADGSYFDTNNSAGVIFPR
jgi:hypothetical protein